MMKYVYSIIAIVFIAGLGACSKKDKGGDNNNGYAPNSCYRSATQGRYTYRNNQCIDSQTSQVVNINLCSGGAYGNNTGYNNGYNTGYGYNNGYNQGGYGYNNSYDPGCNFSNGNGFYNGMPQQGMNPCSQFNSAFEQFYPIYYQQYGGYVCAGFSSYIGSSNWGTPMGYGGYNGWYQGCQPGYSAPGCNCSTWGGTLGWAYAGASIGICY